MGGILDKVGQTVLVLGAGASSPYGFPLGPRLRDQILSKHGQRDEFLHQLNATTHLEMQETLRYFQAQSIDEFLAQYPEHSHVAKLMIAFHLMQAEDLVAAVSPLLPDAWYSHLYRDVLGNDPMLGSGKLSIITFNYDLSLEAYLLKTLCAKHKMDEQTARDRISAMPIVHVHGHIGAIDMLHGKGRAYGIVTPAGMQDGASRIFTIAEAESAKGWEQAHEVLRNARNIGFIGFGFDATNLERLQLNRNCSGRARVFLSHCACIGVEDAFKSVAPGVAITALKGFKIDQQPAVSKVRWIFDEAGKNQRLPPPRPEYAVL